MDIYHVYTNGMAKSLWFQDESDYIFGMNNIPFCALAADINIYCFCLMSNHVHFVIKGREEDCIKFIREYKRLNSKRLSLKYGKEEPLAGADIGIKHIDSVEYLKKVIAYVMRNPLAAGLGVMPSEYRWSSSRVYFADISFRNGLFCRIDELAYLDKQKLFNSRIELPDDYILCSDGLIFPGSYVDYHAVENIYRSPRQLLFFLSSTNDMEEELESGILRKTRYSDSELKASLEVICAEKFSGRRFTFLKIEERYMLARELRKRYGAGPKQLSRITSLEYETLKSMFK